MFEISKGTPLNCKNVYIYGLENLSNGIDSIPVFSNAPQTQFLMSLRPPCIDYSKSDLQQYPLNLVSLFLMQQEKKKKILRI